MSEWDRTGYDKERYRLRKERLLDLIGRTCVSCGSDELIEFDHVDPSSKEFTVTSKWNRPLAEVLPEAAKCQPLCHWCHKEKTRANSSVDHGGGLSGKRNCPCVPCKSRKSEYMRTWKRRRKALRGSAV